MILVSIIVVTGLGLFFALGLVIAEKKFSVKVDPTVEKINEILPGVNCGACGYAGCSGYADGLVHNDASISLCKPGGKDVLNKISTILGKEATANAKMVAHVKCQGNLCDVKPKFKYDGPKTCADAVQVRGSFKDCTFGCVGYGDCVKVCPFDAITIQEGTGHIKIDEEKCTACGICVQACPQNIIEIIPSSIQTKELMRDRQLFVVDCMNTEKGGVARKECSYACIGCGLCEKACAFDAIHVENNLAKIDYDKCKNCAKCYNVCPTLAIESINPRIQRERKIPLPKGKYSKTIKVNY